MGALGVLIIAASWIGGIAFGLYAWIVWGLMASITAATTDPINATALAWGLVWAIFLAKLIAGLIVWGGTAIGGIIVATNK